MKIISVGSGITNAIGRSLIVNRDPDDYTTQPTGNSGQQLACAAVAAGGAHLSACALRKQCFGTRQVSQGIKVLDRTDIVHRHECY